MILISNPDVCEPCKKLKQWLEEKNLTKVVHETKPVMARDLIKEYEIKSMPTLIDKDLKLLVVGYDPIVNYLSERMGE